MYFIAVVSTLYRRVYHKLIHAHIVHIIWSLVLSKASETYALNDNETPGPNLELSDVQRTCLYSYALQSSTIWSVFITSLTSICQGVPCLYYEVLHSKLTQRPFKQVPLSVPVYLKSMQMRTRMEPIFCRTGIPEGTSCSLFCFLGNRNHWTFLFSSGHTSDKNRNITLDFNRHGIEIIGIFFGIGACNHGYKKRICVPFLVLFLFFLSFPVIYVLTFPSFSYLVFITHFQLLIDVM
jgi:hypothetical protein